LLLTLQDGVAQADAEEGDECPQHRDHESLRRGCSLCWKPVG
jgi:hypothetical protein